MTAVAGERVHTTCAYCGVGCGLTVTARSEGGFDVRGDAQHPANYGRLCAKGAALGETMGHEDRLLYPQVHGARVSWDTALTTIAQQFRTVIDNDGPDAVAFYVSGQLLTEDYYVANKLMKGFIGSANIDTNSRLCMASSVAGHKRAFGEDVVPGVYTDLELADVVVLVGSNLAWCHPVLHQRLMDARAVRGTRIVVIDPRATATSADADLHLALKSGTDVALFNGLLRYLCANGAHDERYIAAHTSGLPAALAEAENFDVTRVAALTGLNGNDVEAFYALFAAHSNTVTVYSQGVNQSRAGTDKVNAIINCHLATGRVGQPGSGPFSVTGQPNAMGGRETGGLATMLAAHLEIDNPRHRQAVGAFWNSPRLPTSPGLKAVEMFDAVAAGRIKALWIMATNPAVSMPEANKVAAAIAACPFVVVSDLTARADTAALADVLLPAAGWGEKDGTVTNSERRISRQRAFAPAPGEARPDWWALAGVARRMGYGAAFDYQHPFEIYREFAALTSIARGFGCRLDLARDADINQGQYQALRPRTWPLADGGGHERRLFSDGVFATGDGRARCVPVSYRERSEIDTQQQLILNTGRLRDQWHTMTRSGRVARLAAHTAEPHVEMHPHTARAHGLKAADLAVLETDTARIIARVAVTERQSVDSLFVPMHWSGQTASTARVNTLVAALTDPYSGQPELKAARVRLRRYPANWYAFGIFGARPAAPSTAYWARMQAPLGWRMELADAVAPRDFRALFETLAARAVVGAELLEYNDAARGAQRLVATRDGKLIAALFAAREPVGVMRNWVAGKLGHALERDDWQALVAGFPLVADGNRGAGDIVCTCNQVERDVIVASIVSGRQSLTAIGAATAAGTNCGSCRGDIQRIINDHTLAEVG